MVEKIRELEHISLGAWASLESIYYDGWILRFARGYTGRANSVQPLDSSNLPLDEKIAYCDHFYAERDLPCIFRLTEAMQPAHLETVLDERGYERYNETLVQTASLSNQNFAIDARFHYSDTVSDEWLAAWGRWNAVPDKHIATAKQMLSRTSPSKCFAWIDDIAVGLAVCEGSHVGLFDIVVNPDYRRQKAGKSLVTGLLAWGKSQGATIAYLQVMSINAPALSLYGKIGFTTHHYYWYRRRYEK